MEAILLHDPICLFATYDIKEAAAIIRLRAVRASKSDQITDGMIALAIVSNIRKNDYMARYCLITLN